MNLLAQLDRLGIDRFMVSVLVAVVLGTVAPGLGRDGGLLHLDLLSDYGVGFIFFVYGLTMAPEQLRAGLANWRLHLVIQSTTFLVFPLLIGAFMVFAGPSLDPAMRVGLFFLAVLPSSSVAMNSLARGNMPAAIFNGTLSILAGALITPLMVDAYLAQADLSFDLLGVMFGVALKVGFPIIAGQLLRPLLIGTLASHMRLIIFLDRATIFLIVCNSFANSMANGLWTANEFHELIMVALLCLALTLGVGQLLLLVCARLGFDRPDTVTALFSGTKKSLTSGVPMANVMFAGSPLLGVVVLPIMIYHFLQLLLASITAQYLGKGGDLAALSLRRLHILPYLRRYGVDGFMVALLAAMALAWFQPGIGRSGGLLHLDWFTDIGVGLLFLLYSLTLSPAQIIAGRANWRLHLVVQLATFLLFPAIVGICLRLFGAALDPAMAMGLFFLAAQSSTTASSVVMTSIAKGNVPGARFNASLSTLIGVALKPFWMALYLSQSSGSVDVGGVVFRICLLVVLPIALGQLLRPALFARLAPHLSYQRSLRMTAGMSHFSRAAADQPGAHADGIGRWKSHRPMPSASVIRLLDGVITMALVCNALSDSVMAGLFARGGGEVMLFAGVLSLILIAIVASLVLLACQILGFTREDSIAAVFCGTQKSLVSGVPMADVLFAGSPMLGLVILPLMIYYFSQKVVASFAARHLGNGADLPIWRLRRLDLLARLRRAGMDGFLLALLGSVALSWLLPGIFRSGGLLHVDLFTTYGVGFLFLLYGLTLSPERLKAGLANWRLHVLVQLSTFLLFPILVGAVIKVFGAALPPTLALGLFFLAALPSTVSSSVAMTSIAKGNVPGAIFNASLSTLFGVALTPFWMDWYLSTSATPMDLGSVLFKVTMLVAVPILVGQLLRPILLARITPYMAIIRLMDRATILAMVCNSFSDSVADGVWARNGFEMVLLVAVLSLLLIVGVALLLFLICRFLGFNRADTIAAVFCGTKKSLVSGVPMAEIMFTGSPMLGVVILPLMIFHFLQLALASLVARWLGEGGDLSAEALLRMARAVLVSRPMKACFTLLLVGGGVLGAVVLHLPVPFMLGPAVACAMAALLRLPCAVPDWLASSGAAGLGLVLGGLAVGEAAGSIDRGFGLLLLVLLVTLVSTSAATPFLRRALRLEPFSIWLAALPGAADENPGMPNGGPVALWHAVRSLGTLLALPLLAALVQGGDPLPAPPLLQWGFVGDLAGLAPILLALRLVFQALGWPVPWLLAGFCAALGGRLAFGLGVTPAAPLAGLLGQIVAGAAIGSRLAGVEWRAILRGLPRAGAVAFLQLDVMLMAALGASGLFDLHFTFLLLIFAPVGALEAGALTLALGLADPALAMAVVLGRSVTIALAVPALVALREMATPRTGRVG